MRSIRAAAIGAALVLTVSSCGTDGDSENAGTGCPSSAESRKPSKSWDRPADFDNDGYPDAVDVVTGDPATVDGTPPAVLSRGRIGPLAVFMGGKDGLRPTGRPLADGVVPPGAGGKWKEGFGRTYTADLDADGYTDVLAAQLIPKDEYVNKSTRSMVLFRGGPKGLSAEPVTVPYPSGPAHTESPPTAIGDFNGDDRADVLAPVPGKAPGAIGQILYGPFGSDGRPASTRTVTVRGPAPDLSYYSSLESADIDADGRTDLLLTLETNDPEDDFEGGTYHPLRWFRGSAEDGMVEAESPPGKYSADIMTGTDFDVDGYPDTLLPGPSPKSGGAPMLRGGPDGFRPGVRSLHSDGLGGPLVTGDITGDGRAESVSTIGTGKYATTKKILVSELMATKDGARMRSLQRISHNDNALAGTASRTEFGGTLQLLDAEQDGCSDLLAGSTFTGPSYRRGGYWVLRGGADRLRTDGIRHYGLRELGLLKK
ncbi:FG-GAP repeat domain-containing protein [Streptomyces sp. NPDC017993]|uniref:FG-GAP repeat domain-containing protein n=1 Tax=Streptomyces sp. NPDC017993 TaxID=3365027 RepID=UPI0037B72505